MCGTFGYELDLSTASAAELLQIKDHIEVFKSIAPIIWKGDLYRLWNPFLVTCAIQILTYFRLGNVSLLTEGEFRSVDVCNER
jgi:alpha-galactosidase